MWNVTVKIAFKNGESVKFESVRLVVFFNNTIRVNFNEGVYVCDLDKIDSVTIE